MRGEISRRSVMLSKKNSKEQRAAYTQNEFQAKTVFVSNSERGENPG
jgi:hypothetical protein